MVKVAKINRENLLKQLRQVESGVFDQRLADIRRKYPEALKLIEDIKKPVEEAVVDDIDPIEEMVIDLANDNNTYKGLILAYTAILAGGGKIAQGRRISRREGDLELYRAIFKHDGKNVTEFCRKNRITRNRYYRIRGLEVSHKEDKALLEEIREQVRKAP